MSGGALGKSCPSTVWVADIQGAGIELEDRFPVTAPLLVQFARNARQLGRSQFEQGQGLLREGMAANVIVFDPEQIADRSTYDDGRQIAVGMEHVIVNGQVVLHSGKRTSALPGRVLHR
jgi:N-acyl-D-aspartate/D-glutamate deacylase